MPPFAPRILAAALLEGDDLWAAHMIEHLGADRRTRHGGSAKYGVVAADHQDFAAFHDRAGLGLEPVDPEHVLSGNAILLAARFDDREHLFRPCVRTRYSDPRARIGFLRSVISVLLQELSVEPTRRCNKSARATKG